jgi:hypothetical protein
VHVDKASQRLEPRSDDGEQESWAYVVTELTETEVQEELDSFNSTTVWCYYPPRLATVD